MTDDSSPQPKATKRPGSEDAAPMRAVERVAAILRTFTQREPILSLSEVALRAGLDKNTTRRMLLALCQTGLVQRFEEDGRYGLDIGMLKFQPAVHGPRPIREIAAPFLQGLSERTQMTSFIWLTDSEGAICIERVRASEVFLDVPWATPGTVVPLNMAAGPRVILAWLSEADRAAWLSRPQPRFTQFSQSDPVRLAEEARLIRERGYELIANDYYVGMAGLGVPLVNRAGGFVGSISVTTGAADFDAPERLQTVLTALRETASAIGLRLGPGLATTG